MTNFIALLRAVNVGAHNKVAMGQLRELAGGLGFRNVQSLLRSGNLVFGCGEKSKANLEGLLEAAAAEKLNLRTDFFVRTAEEWQQIISENPFPEQAKRSPQSLVALLLKSAPKPTRVAALKQAITGPEQVHVQDRHAYIVYPDGIGRSRLTTAFVESKLGTRATGRNWNTMLKLAALAQPD